MKIRIVKCSSDHYWYTGHIGKEFEVLEDISSELGHCVNRGRLLNSYVAFEDAEIIEEPVTMVKASDDSVIAVVYALQASRKLDQDMLKDFEKPFHSDFLKADSGRFTDPGPHINNMPKFENPPNIPNPRLCMEGRDLNLPDEDGWWLY